MAQIIKSFLYKTVFPKLKIVARKSIKIIGEEEVIQQFEIKLELMLRTIISTIVNEQ